MALSSVYSFMRAHSSNRRLAQAGAPSPLTQKERNALLLRKLRQLSVSGWSAESQSESQPVMVRSVPHHRLHLILTLATIGVWALVWIALVLIGSERRVAASVDEWGNTRVRRAARPPRGPSRASV